MRILLVNVDSHWNMAIRRMYNYFTQSHTVDMIDLGFSAYPHKKTKVIDASEYDRVYVSNIFDINKDRVTVTGCDWVQFGGIGSNNPSLQLPPEIENTDPFYFDDEDTSYGFITRGCIRNCWFCKVPKYEGKLKVYNDVERIVKHKKAVFLDNNILAYEHHCEVFQWLIDHDIKCDFNQGLDFRLINDKNMELLSKLKYMSTAFTFAFDDPKYEKMLEKKLVIMKKWVPRPWGFRFYIYYHPNMSIKELIRRVEWCRERECLPYIMRDSECWNIDDPKLRKFIIDYAGYCNQPSFFKKETFEEYLTNTKFIGKKTSHTSNDMEIYNKYK